MKHMVANLSKLDKFEGVDFRRWQKKMHFLLSTMSMVYVLNMPIPDDEDDATVHQLRRMDKWENNDYVFHGIILNSMANIWLRMHQAMKSQDVAFWKESINDEMDSIMGNNTWVLADLPPADIDNI
ncbi:hypothetical protein Tco_0585790 [Tanacetum coccineum]